MWNDNSAYARPGVNTVYIARFTPPALPPMHMIRPINHLPDIPCLRQMIYLWRHLFPRVLQ